MDSKPQTPKPQPSKTPNDKKNPTLGTNVVWYLLAVGIGILLVVGWLHQEPVYDIPISDLNNLITNGEVGVRVAEATDGKKPAKRNVTYQNPTDLELSASDVTGKVTRTID